MINLEKYIAQTGKQDLKHQCYKQNYVITVMHISLSKKNTVQTENNKAIDGYNRNLIVKNNTQFIICVSKIKNLSIDNAENLDTVMPMYNLIKCIKNYRKTTGIMEQWNYYKNFSTELITNSEFFKYKASITGKTANDENAKEVEFSV